MAKANVFFQKRGIPSKMVSGRFFWAVACILNASPAWADNLATPPPYRENVTGPGSVNVVTGNLSLSFDDLTSGLEGTSDFMKLSRLYNITSGYSALSPFGDNATHSLIMSMSFSQCWRQGQATNVLNCRISANFLGKSYEFLPYNGGGLATNRQDGAKIEILDQSNTVFKVTDKSGAFAIFELSGGYFSGSPSEEISTTLVKFVQFPDGGFFAFSYQYSGTYTSIGYPNPNSVVNRLESVTNSRGYGISFSYINSSSGGNLEKQKRIVSRADAFYIDCSSSCYRHVTSSSYYNYWTPSGPLDNFQQQQYYLSGVTRPDGSQQALEYDLTWGGLMSAVRNPANSYADATFTYDLSYQWFDGISEYPINGPLMVTSFKDGSGNKTYYSYDLNSKTMAITTPGSNIYQYHSKFEPRDGVGNGNQPVPDWIKDPLQRITNYNYDTWGRFLSVTYPEGNTEQQTLDSRENATEIRKTAKAGSGLPDIVQTFHFPDCDSSNYRICNKPDYSVDGRGKRSDFQYDAASGGLKVSLAPADANGSRAIKRITYSQYSPAPGTTVPSGISVPLTSLPIYEDECRISGVTNTNIDFDYACPSANRSRVVRLYEPSSSSTPSMHRLIGVTNEADGQSLTTSYSYDAVGNVIAATNPRGNVTYTTYDSQRRKVFEIGLDPDGNGPLPRPVVRHAYNSDGNEIRTEVGTGFATDGSDFTVLHFKRMTYYPGTNKILKVEEVLP